MSCVWPVAHQKTGNDAIAYSMYLMYSRRKSGACLSYPTQWERLHAVDLKWLGAALSAYGLNVGSHILGLDCITYGGVVQYNLVTVAASLE